MTVSNYRMFDGTILDLSAIAAVGSLEWIEDPSRPGACGEFRITLIGGKSQRLSFGISSIVGGIRFMEVVRKCSDHAGGDCPTIRAYASLRCEARRLLAMHHGDLVSARNARLPALRRAA